MAGTPAGLSKVQSAQSFAGAFPSDASSTRWSSNLGRRSSLINIDVLGTETADEARLRLHMMATIFSHAPRELIQMFAEIYKDELKKAAPKGKRGAAKGPGSIKKRQGSLAESHIYRTFERGGGWGARFYAHYIALFVIKGTAPHEIWAGAAAGAPGYTEWGTGGNWKRALYWEGAPHPSVKVNHPGTRPNDYRNKAAEMAIPRIKTVVAAWERGIVLAEA